MSTSVNSQQASGSPASASQMSALGLPGHKVGRKQFKNYVSKVKHDAFAYANMVAAFHQAIKKGNKATLGSDLRFKITNTAKKHLLKFAESGKIIPYTDDTFALAQPLEISSDTLKKYKSFVSVEFDMINDASKLGSKRSGVSTSGVALTDEGFNFMAAAFFENSGNPDSIFREDVNRYAREHEIPEEKLNDFYNIFVKFQQALTLSLSADYGDDAINGIFRGVIGNTLSTKLLHLYKKFKYEKSPSGRYVTNGLIASMSNAYAVAVNKAQEKVNELAAQVGLQNWEAYDALLNQYFRPVLTSSELAAIARARTKGEKHRLEKEFKLAHRAALLQELRRFNPRLSEKQALSDARSLSALTSADEFTNQTFMSMAHAILDRNITDDRLKSTRNTKIEKVRKQMLVDAITSTESDFTNYVTSNPENVREKAFALIAANDPSNNNGLAVAAKYINNYISSATKFIESFIKNNSLHQPKRRTKKHDQQSLASVLY